MTKAHETLMRSTVLPQWGKRPLRFTGALLVETSGASKGACGSDTITAACGLAIYETSNGFVGQLCVSLTPAMPPISAALQAADPQAIRRWIADFDPSICVETHGALADEAAAITARLAHIHAALDQAVTAAFGLNQRDLLAA